MLNEGPTAQKDVPEIKTPEINFDDDGKFQNPQDFFKD